MGGSQERGRLVIDSAVNPYRDNVQGKANEPICVAGNLDHARWVLGSECSDSAPDSTLEEIYDRLEANAPRIAIIGGSKDHPAHIVDHETVARASLAIWQNGGVPFYFGVPVMCDGTAQNNQGMSYSLESRNAVAGVVVNQMESHSYHGAFVIQGCDKTPLGIVAGLAHLDHVRQRRGETPVWATFAPAHVLKGGIIPREVANDLEELASRLEKGGHDAIAGDLRDTMGYILQCSSNTAFQGVLARAVEVGALTATEHKEFEKRLAVNTCDGRGGICAFNGTGNSSRHLVAGLGLIHPAVELLTTPPAQSRIKASINGLFDILNRPEYSVRNLLKANIGNAIRIHSSTGGSTNLMMHLVAAMIMGGFRFTIWDLDRIHNAFPVPDLFDYSLTQGRDIFQLAKQCCAGDIRGMETLFNELVNNGVPMDLDAPTVTGTTWRERLSNKLHLSPAGVRENPIILERPRRAISGVDVLRGNFFESAVVKISGMPEHQVDEFDDLAAFVLYYDNEDEANRGLLNEKLMADLRDVRAFTHEELNAMHAFNRGVGDNGLSYDELFDKMVKDKTLKIAVVIAGQGPLAFGMPEMFTPMQHINANAQLKKQTMLISDGRFSGVSYGAAIGHVTPEAMNRGGILYLKTGDVLWLRLRTRRIELLDKAAFLRGKAVPAGIDLAMERKDLGAERLERITRRQKLVAAMNRLVGHTDAALGVVPLGVWEEAEEELSED